ncbi:MAG: TRAP transporter small permease [Bacteroidota bacterium]|nr:TRAP transporter small permease [Bacteroidota bacterium]MDE2833444.1 TRAP transporter small permease [Bacteroidota bacterium]MDE2958393.1 TRAP transporter small permease [Bacteroidota bacterium]
MTRTIDRSLAAILIALMIAMVITVSWQVITRYLLNSPSSYTEELATYLLIWISLLGAAYALRVRAHLGIDILVRQMGPQRRRQMRFAAYLVVILFALVALVFGGSWLVYVTLDLNQLSAAFQVPIGYVYLVLPISGLLMTHYSVIAMLELRNATPKAASPN